jgi:predicted AlkP superfamily pyrophosphatase or phosphodiesterase/uncharacterized membrane protein YvlD (DUF360 family)
MDFLRRLGRLYRAQFRTVGRLKPTLGGLLLRTVAWVVVAWLSLGIAVWLTPGVAIEDGGRVLVAVTIMAVLEVAIRPLLMALALPIGLIAVAVIGLLFRIALFLFVLPLVGIAVDGFLVAIIASGIYAAVLTVLGGLIGMTDEDSFSARVVAQVVRDEERAPTTDVPGVLFVQIDGLAQPLLAAQLRAGNLPTLSRWVRSGSHRLIEWTAMLPSQTSASQAGLLLGSNDGIPAFRWYEKENRRLMVSNHGKDAEEIERRLSTGNGLLADGGASIDNMFSGDAPITRLTMSKVGTDQDQEGRKRSIYYFLLDPYSLGRTLVRTIGEALKEYYQAWQQTRREVEPRMHRGGTYPWLRAATNVTLRDLNIALVSEQMLRGTPSIYVDFLDYDEIAHHSGPERIEALHALEGIDRSLGRLERLAADCPRPYRLVILSDHGQSLGATFRQRHGQTVEDLIRERIKAVTVREAVEPTEQWGRLSTVLTEVSATDGAASRATRRMLSDQTRDGVVELGPMADEASDEPANEALPDLVVCASGNLALVFFGIAEGRLTLEQIEAVHPGLVNYLAGHPGIGMILVNTEAEGSVALGPAGSYHLRDGTVVGDSPLTPYGPLAPLHLARLDGIEHVGDLALISRVDEGTEEVAAFEELIGSHGGLGGWQTRASLLYPADWPAPEESLLGAPAVHRQLKAWLTAAQRGGTATPAAEATDRS